MELGEEFEKLFGEMTEELSAIEDTDDEKYEESPIIARVNAILTAGVERRASHIHCEPSEAGYRVRYRVDGVLQDVVVVPKALVNPLISRIKILSNLDVADRRRPQDGRLQILIEGTTIDMMVSVHPTVDGERIVIRPYSEQHRTNDIDDLGMSPRDLASLKSALRNRSGVLLIAGESGSGRTTTLYSALNHLKSSELSVMTAEDPVECSLKEVAQSLIKEKLGFTYSAALRSMMRQDPDVIMVQTLGDPETASLAVQMALGGRLVLGAVHSQCACSALLEMKAMEIAPAQIGSAVRFVLTQKLVRRNCENCIVESPMTAEETRLIDATLAGLSETTVLRRSTGCEQCGGSGYHGRLPVCEILPVSEAIRGALRREAELEELKAIAIDEGMEPLDRSAMRHVVGGSTSMEELLRNFPDVR